MTVSSRVGLIMFSGITATCFVSSYLVALVLAAARPLTQNRLRRPAMIGFAFAGIFAHSLYLGSRAGDASASPLSTPYDWYLLAAWVVAALYFYLEFYYPKAAVGIFVMPLVLALIGAAQFADQQPFSEVRASRLWGNVHGTSLLIGTVTVIVGFIAGLMYLVQSYRLKHKMVHSDEFRLPSLERLERINSRAIVTSVLFIGIGFVSGIELAMIKGGRAVQSIPWSNPVVIGLALMFGWLLVASGFSLFYRAARHGRKVAYLTVATFIFLLITMGVMLLTPSQHGSAKTDLPQASSDAGGPS